ncbi:MAG: glycosyltransferase family 39 protein [Myxococcales bacterium]|nr:glycosyltransferase family 39 protein [Myxococcales bacterium]
MAGRRSWKRALIALVVALGAYVVRRALTLRTGPWDAYLYLDNARAIVSGGATYTLDKPPLLPLLYAPSASSLWPDPAQEASMWLLQLQAAALSLLSMVAVFRVFSRSLGPTLAWVGVLLSMGNVVFIRYAPMVMTDVLGAGLVALVFASWMRARGGGRNSAFVVAGIGMGCAAALRYQFAVLPLGIALAELVIGWRRPRVLRRRLGGALVAGIVSAVLFFLLHALVYWAIERPVTPGSFLEALEYAAAGARRERPHEEPWHYATMLATCLSPLVLLLAAAGLTLAVRRRREVDLLFGVWLLSCTAPLLRVDHNEIRYLYAAFPALIYFALLPVQQLAGRIDEASLGRGAKAGIAVGAPVLLLIAIWPGLDQIRRDESDPFFTTDVARASSLWLLRATPQGLPFVWLGFGHSAHARDLHRLVDDEFFNVFHLGPHVFEHFTARPMLQWGAVGTDPVATAIGLRPGGAGVIVGAAKQLSTRELIDKGNPNRAVEALVIEPLAPLAPMAVAASGGRPPPLRQVDGGWVATAELREVRVARFASTGQAVVGPPLRIEAGQRIDAPPSADGGTGLYSIRRRFFAFAR